MDYARAVLAATLLLLAQPSAAAKDEAVDDAQFNAKMVMLMARLVHEETGAFDAMTVAAVKAKHPELTVVDDGPSTNPSTVGIKVMGHFRVVTYASGNCWGIREPTPAERLPSLYARKNMKAEDCKASSFADADFGEHTRVWPKQ
jgi:hypothetical protein